MAHLFQVERDAEGLRLATRELFEQAFAEDCVRKLLEKVGDDETERERILADMPPRTLSPGYYDRSAYLLDLSAAIESGVQYAANVLTRVDVVGLQMVKRAKAEFERDHPSCPRCGTRQDNRWMRSCKQCNAKFGGGSD